MSIPRLRSRSLPHAAGLLGRAALLLVAATAVACGGADESAAPAASDSASDAPRKVGAPSGSPAADVAREAEEQAELLQGTIPKGFPSDVPRYPGAKADNALSLGGTSFVSFKTDGSSEEVLEYYRNELRAQGWSVRDGGNDSVEGSKGGRRVTVRASAAEAGTKFAVSVSGG